MPRIYDRFADLDQVVRGWDALERRSGGSVVDFDLAPAGQRPRAVLNSRAEVRARLADLAQCNDPVVGVWVAGHRFELDARCGKLVDVARHISVTQACVAEADADALRRRRSELEEALGAVGVPFGADLPAMLDKLEAPIPAGRLEQALRDAADRWVPEVAALADVDIAMNLSIELVDEDVFWAYWLDGGGRDARLRVNLRRASFTASSVTQFALHEVAGHALQFSSWAAGRERARTTPATVCLHSPVQIGAEGVAQILPLLVAADDPLVGARCALGLYVQEALAEIHLLAGADEEAALVRTRQLLPWMPDERAEVVVRDRRSDPTLRGYLWAYVEGARFWRHVVTAKPHAVPSLLHEAYRAPRTLAQLHMLVD